MPIVEVPAQLTVEHLLNGVKQLSPAELREFTQRLAEWRRQSEASAEAALLAAIEENARLPEKKQRLYQQLRRKCEYETSTADELRAYQALLQELEARNVKSIGALTALAQRRGTTLRDVMAELGLGTENRLRQGDPSDVSEWLEDGNYSA